MTPQELYQELTRLIEAQDAAGAEAFIMAHLNEFPEEVRDQLLQAVIVSSIEEEAHLTSTIAGLQEEAIEAIHQIEIIEEELDNQDRIDALKKEINAPEGH